MDILIRREEKNDFREVEELTREAFWNIHFPGCSEHLLIHTLRDREEFIKELDFVATLDNKIVGNIVYARAKVVDDSGGEHNVITFGPVSVLPEYQNRGIGGKLIEHTKAIARSMGFNAIIITGDPEYYKRVGFVAAEVYDIRNSDGMFAAYLQLCELYDGAMKGISGRFYEGEAYSVDENQCEEFDKTFPYKEKAVIACQARFLELTKQIHE
ncbi:MAG: N-acetyltransferase [Clostridia bacterium]|nr:N-acetyltransferase [Clostridia bacterium]